MDDPGRPAAQQAPDPPEPSTGDVSFALLDTFLASVPLPMALVDTNLTVIRANEDMAVALGRSGDDLCGRSIGEAMPGLAAMVAPAVEQALATSETVSRVEICDREVLVVAERHWQLSAFPVVGAGGDLIGAGLVLIDVTHDHQAARDLVDRARRMAAVASLGQRALAGRPLTQLLDDAVRLVSTTLGFGVVQAFELLPGGELLLLRAASGVPEDLIGVAEVEVGRSSQAGYTLMTRAPVVSEDIRNDSRFAVQAHGLGLGVNSGVTVVISGSGSGAWGVFAAHSVAHHSFSADDVHFLELVANVLGVAIQRKQAEDDLRESHARVDLSLKAGGLVSWEWDLASNGLRWEGRLPGMVGREGALGDSIETFLERVHPDDRRQVALDMQRVRSASDEYHATFRMRLSAGDDIRWLEVRASPVTGGAGSPTRLLGVAADVTERRLIEEIKSSLLEGEHHARIEAESARERLSLLAEAGSALANSLEPRSTLLVLRDLLLPRMCDGIALYAMGADEFEEVCFEHVDPTKAGLLAEVRLRRRAAGGEGMWSARRAMRTGRSELVERITGDDLIAAALDDEYHEMLVGIDPGSAISMPLVARGRVMGALTMLRGSERPPFSPDDLALVEELGSRTALAVDNARLFESRSAVARTLQRSLLPPALPKISGVDIATRYRVAGGEIEIGGDFYDLFEVGGGAWAVIIGDVCGKGTVAAALTGLFRHTVRAAAVRETAPSQILRFTNQIILHQIEDTRFCTAAMLRVEPGHTGLAITASCGGHPLPLVLRNDGTVERVEAAGTLIGVVADPTLHDVELLLDPGEAIVLYTDGVTEARRGSELFGERRLMDVLTGHQDLDAFALTDLVESAVENFQGADAADDTAILVLRALSR